MNITPAQLQELIAELHQINEELAAAARPLERLPDLNEDQRQAVRAALNAGHARWRDISERIDQALGISTNGRGREGTP